MQISELPTLSPARLAIKVKPKLEKTIRQGHPWLFEEAITKLSKEGSAGDISILYDNRRNKVMAIGLYDPHSIIRVKMLHFNGPANINEDWFKEKIDEAFAKRASLLATDTNSYRLLHGENDGMPSFIADVYDKVLVVKLYSAIWMPYLTMILPHLLEVSKTETIVLRLARSLQKLPEAMHGLSDGQVINGELKEEDIIFREHGLRFSANVIHGHKTGFFLDHRHNRKRVGELSEGKAVLDIFSYAGGFSVHALAGGAHEVISLDISAQALAMAKANVQLNDLSANHKVMAIDAFKGMEQLINQGKLFDIVIVDPPSFAKSASEIKRALHSYAQLTQLAIKLVRKGGILLSASCSSRVSSDAFFDTVTFALKQSNRRWTELERTFHDDDHPIGFEEGRYLKSGYFRIN